MYTSQCKACQNGTEQWYYIVLKEVAVFRKCPLIEV